MRGQGSRELKMIEGDVRELGRMNRAAQVWKMGFLPLMGLGLILFSWGCPPPGLIIPPVFTPTPTPTVIPAPPATPVCGFTQLPSTFGAASPALIVIRNSADWAAYSAGSTCTTPGSAPISDFGTHMVLAYPRGENIIDPRSSWSFTSVCLYSDRMEVNLDFNYQESIGAPALLGPCLTPNLNISVPYTTLPIHFTQCDKLYNFTGLISTTCSTTLY